MITISVLLPCPHCKKDVVYQFHGETSTMTSREYKNMGVTTCPTCHWQLSFYFDVVIPMISADERPKPTPGHIEDRW